MRVEVLGSARAVADDGSLITFDRRHRRVLAALAASSGDATLDALVDAVWSGEPPAAAHKTTQNLLSDLRRTLGQGTIERSGDSYRLADLDVDAAEFSRLAVNGSDAPSLRAGLAAWRGAPFADLDDWPTATIERSRLIELRLGLEERLAGLDIEQGRGELAAADLEALVAAEPYREHRWALLVRAHTAVGRRAAALAAFQRARKVLVVHLGLEPGAELLAAEREALVMPLATRRDRPPVGLIGRRGEREVLMDAWQRALDGATQVIVLVGEAGIGKTHLADACAAEVAATGALVGLARADEAAPEGSSPLTDALRDSLAELEPDDEDVAVDLSAALANLLAGTTGDRPSSSELAAARLARELSSAIAGLTTRAPVLLVLDDMHWARPDGLELLRQVVVSRERARLLVLLCVRDEPPTLVTSLHTFIEQVQGRVLPLGGLDADEIAELLGWDSASLAAQYHYETAGNPLACLLLAENHWRPGTAAPPTVAAAVRARLARLEPDHVSYVQAAALTGLEFDPALVAAAVGASSSSPSAAIDAGLVEAMPDRRHRFRHPLFRAAIADSVPATTATARHRELAMAMRELTPAKVPEIAHHLVAAASLDVALRPQAVAWAHRAAVASERQAAFDDAARWYEAALRLHEVDDHERYDLLLGQARALGARPGWEFRGPARAAATLAHEELDDDVLCARALLAANRDWPSADGRVDGPFVGELEAAAARLAERDLGLRAMLLAALAAELVFDLDGWRRRRIADEALRLAEQSGDKASLRHVLCRRPAAIWDLATAAERRESALRYLDMAPPSELAGRLTALAAAATASIELVDLDAAALLLARTAELTEGLPAGHYTVMHDSVELVLLLARGELAEVRRRADLLPEGSGAPKGNFLLCADIQEGRGGAAAAESAELVRPAELAPFVVLLGAADRPDAAAATLEQLPPALWASVAPSTVRALVLGSAAYAAGLVGHREHAEALLPLLEPVSANLLCVGQVSVGEPVALTVGRLHLVLGNVEAARQRFRQAHRIATTVGNPNWCRLATEALGGLPVAG
jgi:DNA-binding SARP family transcriptional activator